MARIFFIGRRYQRLRMTEIDIHGNKQHDAVKSQQTIEDKRSESFIHRRREADNLIGLIDDKQNEKNDRKYRDEYQNMFYLLAQAGFSFKGSYTFNVFRYYVISV